MIKPNHIVKKFSFELQTPGREQSRVLQKRFVKIVNENLAEGIDKILSSYFPGDEMVRINKIEIDLGDITSESLEKDFAAKCLESFANKVKAIPVKQQPHQAEEAHTVSKEENAIEQLFYFLSSGKILWTAYNMNFQEWQVAITEAIKAKTNFFKQGLSSLLQAKPQAVERLVMQFDDEFTAALVELYHPHVKKAYENLSRVLKEQILTTGSSSIRKNVLAKVLFVLLGTKSEIEQKDVRDIIELSTVKYAKESDEKYAFNIVRAIATIAEKLGIDFNAAQITEVAGAKAGESNIINKIKEGEESKVENKEADDKSIFINNAGIIILHPFLKNIFKVTGLLQEEEFKDDFSKQKAVHLLQYMASHEKEMPEYLLQLNKILCGLSEEEHIDRFIPLEESVTKEADELLEAVITHWTTLKNTSAAALQETFFQRTGKLTFNEADGYWKLQVERKAVDILMDKIPWGISYIQLPWMKYALVTEW